MFPYKSHLVVDFCFFFFLKLFLAVLGLHCCTRAFSSCGERGLLFVRCADFSLRWLLLLRSMGSRRAGSVVVAHGLSCSAACGIFPDQGLNLCPPHWQARFLTTAPPGKSTFAFLMWYESLLYLLIFYLKLYIVFYLNFTSS